jgi:hypothetical protein
VSAARGRALVACIVSIVVCMFAAPRAAQAWGTAEHQEIGTAAYLGACQAVAAALAKTSDAEAARFELVCGRNRAVLARLYGDATAIAGDFVGHPSELLSPAGAWRFSSPKHYYLLALENSSHFNPMATQTWREYHEAALGHALAAAAAEGLPAIDAFEQAMRENAFADHLLQDSFASGHMGFNRRASSSAAAKTFHDHWNAHGRTVTDRTGASWRTYGDGKLDAPEDADGRTHVIGAATASVQDVLLTFVTGRPHPEVSLTAWRLLPFTVEAPPLVVDAEALVTSRASVLDTSQAPLLSMVRPARKNTVANAQVWTASPFTRGDPTVAATANIELAIPVLPAQTSLGAGATLHRPDGRQALIAEGGLLAHLGLSVDGLFSHEVAATASVLFLHDVRTLIHGEYQLNLELGDWLVTLHAGLAWFLRTNDFGWYAALGFGYAFSAAGGGSF